MSVSVAFSLPNAGWSKLNTRNATLLVATDAVGVKPGRIVAKKLDFPTCAAVVVSEAGQTDKGSLQRWWQPLMQLRAQDKQSIVWWSDNPARMFFCVASWQFRDNSNGTHIVFLQAALQQQLIPKELLLWLKTLKLFPWEEWKLPTNRVAEVTCRCDCHLGPPFEEPLWKTELQARPDCGFNGISCHYDSWECPRTVGAHSVFLQPVCTKRLPMSSAVVCWRG